MPFFMVKELGEYPDDVCVILTICTPFSTVTFGSFPAVNPVCPITFGGKVIPVGPIAPVGPMEPVGPVGAMQTHSSQPQIKLFELKALNDEENNYYLDI